jgi:PD-(D/E)XK nuclease superfamily protein
MNEKLLLHGELSHAVIGCAMTVLNELKPGLDEKAYENALVLALLLNFKPADLRWKRIIR